MAGFIAFAYVVSDCTSCRKGHSPDCVLMADKKYFPNKIPISKEDKQCVNRLAEMGISAIAQEYPDDEPLLIKPFR